jgi:hypothetical protein
VTTKSRPLTVVSRDQTDSSPAIVPDSSPAPARPGELAELVAPVAVAGRPASNAARPARPAAPAGFSRSPRPPALRGDAFALLMSLAADQDPAIIAGPVRGSLAAPPAGPGPAPGISPGPAPRASGHASGVPEPAGRVLSRSTAWSGLASGRSWPLAILLCLQAALSLRLVWSNTAFPDEGLYLWAGRLELAHLLHGGAALPDFASYFSGAPVLYPPLGAAAAAIGGLAGARLLSLVLLLGATVLLHGLTRRLFDRRAAFFAAALFAGLAATQYLGAFATYDALALFCLAAATWLGVRAGLAAGSRALVLAASAAGVLALANAAKYASGLFDPVVLAAAAAAAWTAQGKTAAVRAGGVMAGTLAAVLALAIGAGGGPYLHGITSTTLDRPSGSYPAIFLLYASGKWLWPVLLLAVLGVLAAATAGRGVPFAVLAAVLAAAILLAPAEQARIHTYTSLFKHDGYGAWFACAVAGYALAALSRLVPQAKALTAFRTGLALVAIAAVPGIPTALAHFRAWPDSTGMTAAVSGDIARHPGRILADDNGDLLYYYLGRQMTGVQATGTWYFSYRDPASGERTQGQAAYADAIDHGYFSVIMLDYWDNGVIDGAIEHDLSTGPGPRLYTLAQAIPFTATGVHSQFDIWVRTAAR